MPSRDLGMGAGRGEVWMWGAGSDCVDLAGILELQDSPASTPSATSPHQDS